MSLVDSKSLSSIVGTECLPCLLPLAPPSPFGGKGNKFLADGSFGGSGNEFVTGGLDFKLVGDILLDDVSDFKLGGVLLLGGKGIGLSVEGFGGSGGG